MLVSLAVASTACGSLPTDASESELPSVQQQQALKSRLAAAGQKRGLRSQQEPFQRAGKDTVAIDTTIMGKKYLPLSVDGRITGLSMTGRVAFGHAQGIVRVVLVGKDGHEYLVYESYPGIEDAESFSVTNVCEETCALNDVEPAELWIQAQGAILDINRLTITRERAAEEVGRRKHAQHRFKIDRLTAHAAAHKSDFRASATSVSELTYAEKRKMFPNPDQTERFLPNLQGFEYYTGGTYQLPPSSLNGTATSLSPSTSVAGCTLAKAVDWRNSNGSNYVTPVRNQGSCGSCYAFAALGAAEARIAIQYKQPITASNPGVELSEQDAMCSNGGCSGGFPQNIFEQMARSPSCGYGGSGCSPISGLLTAQCMPYTASSSGCTSARSSALSRPECQGLWRLGSYNALRDTSSIKSALAAGPVSVSLRSILHAMAAVGYEDYSSCSDGRGAFTRWIFKNSWGTGWGESGFARVVVSGDDVSAWSSTVYEVDQPVSLTLNKTASGATISPPCYNLAQCGSYCQDIQSDSKNCGACGRSCGSGESCAAGKCCSAGYGGSLTCH